MRLVDILKLLRENRPEDVVREMEAFRETVQLSRLELAGFRQLARVEDELHKFFLVIGAEVGGSGKFVV